VGTAKEKLYHILENHVPENAVHYCFDLWAAAPFNFKVSRSRSTKLGDYKYDKVRKGHTITVNHNLNQYLFLITYIHEVAHLRVTEQHGIRTSPHGREWKSLFSKLMQPVLNNLIFPDDILSPLRRHLENPKASSQSDLNLVMALRKYDPDNGLRNLGEIGEGEVFIFKGKRYKKLDVRRTRVLCQHCNTGRKYLIPKIALVEQV
jgi:hypothetical protein